MTSRIKALLACRHNALYLCSMVIARHERHSELLPNLYQEFLSYNNAIHINMPILVVEEAESIVQGITIAICAYDQ